VLTTCIRKQLLEITLPVQRTSTYTKQVQAQWAESPQDEKRVGQRNSAGRVLTFRSVRDLSRLPGLNLFALLLQPRHARPEHTRELGSCLGFCATDRYDPAPILMCIEYFDLIQPSRAVAVPVVESCMLRLGVI